MDYHERTPQPPPPHDLRAGWAASENIPGPRAPYGDRAGDDRPPPSAGGRFRPRYSDQDYADHGYWDDGQPDRRYATGNIGARPPDPPQQRGDWNFHETPSGHFAPVIPTSRNVDGDRDYPATLWWTAIWYAAMILLYALLALVISTSSMRSQALHAIITDAPGAILAIAFSLGIAAAVRRTTLAWRAISVGFASTIVGAGIATLLISVV